MFGLLVLNENLEVVKVALAVVAKRTTEDVFDGGLLTLCFPHSGGLQEFVPSKSNSIHDVSSDLIRGKNVAVVEV